MKKRIFSLFFVSALAMGLLSCAYLQTQQRQLAEKLVRLHVVANSDSPSDQAIKLRVRDAVLAAAEEMFPGMPVILGGDLNTNTFDGRDKDAIQEIAGDAGLQRRCLEDVARWEGCLGAAEAA